MSASRSKVDIGVARDLEESLELRLGHLSRGHHELAVLHLAKARDVTVDLAVVRWVRENGVDKLAEADLAEVFWVPCIAAEQDMATKLPRFA